jgi:hypothetical protein
MLSIAYYFLQVALCSGLMMGYYWLVLRNKRFHHNVKALTDPGYGAKEEAIRMIVKGPKWKPATQNGKNVTYLHTQSITFLVAEK